MKSFSETPLKKVTLIESAYIRLKADILAGRRKKQLPGTGSLAKELSVSRTTLLRATERLLEDGFLISNGQGRRMSIRRVKVKKPHKSLFVAILLLNHFESLSLDSQQDIIRFDNLLRAAGHITKITSCPVPRSAENAPGVSRWLETVEADAAVACTFPEKQLRALLGRNLPLFAAGGACRNLTIAGAGFDFGVSTAEALRALFRLGHTRVVVIAEAWIRNVSGGFFMPKTRAAFEEAGLRAGNYNIPDWEETPEGLEKLLHELFKVTPPTALILKNSIYALGGRGVFEQARLARPGRHLARRARAGGRHALDLSEMRFRAHDPRRAETHQTFFGMDSGRRQRQRQKNLRQHPGEISRRHRHRPAESGLSAATIQPEFEFFARGDAFFHFEIRKKVSFRSARRFPFYSKNHAS